MERKIIGPHEEEIQVKRRVFGKRPNASFLPEGIQVITLSTRNIRSINEARQLFEALSKNRMFNKNLPILIEQTDEQLVNGAIEIHLKELLRNKFLRVPWIVIRTTTGQMKIIVNNEHRWWESFDSILSLNIPPTGWPER